MRAEGNEEESTVHAARPGLILLWGAATALGMGAGWYVARDTGITLLWGVPIAICQGLLLLPNWRRALEWTALTCVGWLFALAFMFLFAFPLTLLVRESLTTYNSQLAPTILLLIFFGVPIVTFVQCSAINGWVRREHWSVWFGASACSFPVAALFGAMLIDILAPAPCLQGISGCLPGLVEVQYVELKLVVIGALWGGCLGWAMGRMPEVRKPKEGR